MAFIGYPSAFLFPEPRKMQNRSSVDHYPWGYFVSTTGERKNGFVQVRHRSTAKDGTKRTHAWIREDDLQENRILEVNFVDIGQGDGCFIVFPNDKRMVIDAGEGDNMYRFLRWRFNRRKTKLHNVVISHPDKDHYFGFNQIVKDEKFSFGDVYHNGIVERTGSGSLGPRTSGSNSELTDVIETEAQLRALVSRADKRGRKLYPNLIHDILESGRVSGEVRMLRRADGHVPGFEPGKPVVLEVLGPIARQQGQRLRLPWLGSIGETKNGHSVVLRLTFGGVSMLLGGDLNIPSEHYLLHQLTGLDPEPKNLDELEALLTVARRTFECDVMKACHHGSADFSEVFIESVNPIATVISSGDGESHSHPRPDALGTYGKHSRGRRPLIFSTELARSGKEHVGTPQAIQDRIEELIAVLRSANATDEEKSQAEKEINELTRRRERAVAVYGMITVRTDGVNAILTQKLEAKRGSTGEKWDIHRLEPGPDGRLEYQSKH